MHPNIIYWVHFMKLITFKLSDKRLVAAFLALCVAFLIMLDFMSQSSKNSGAVCDNESRLLFIRSLGLEAVEQAVSVKETVIPIRFNDVYSRYNKLQLEAGYDLTKLSGETVTVYCYDVGELRGSPTYVNLIIYKDSVVGGDISSAELSGFMLPLKEIKE